jgi:hypothetical protein
MKTAERDRNDVWLYVFGLTMRDRASIPGDASMPLRRFDVAVRNADEAVKDEKTLASWLAAIEAGR